mgnify:CR=1 FL=1
MPDTDIPGICVVTQPARRETGKNHAYTLLKILSGITAVSVITANLSEDSPIRTEFKTTEFTEKGTGDSIPVAALRFFVNQVRLCAAIRRTEEEAVLFFGASSYVLPVVFSRLIGKTVIVEPRGDVPLSLRLKWENQTADTVARLLAGVVWSMERVSYYAATAIITYTPSMADELGLGRFENKLYTDGARYVDTEKFDVETPFEERDDVVGFVGRLDVEKGVDKMVEVAKMMPDEIGFVFVGDGDYKDMIESELAEEISSGKVETVGWVDHEEVPRYLNSLKLHLLISDPTEGLPTIILESFACGTPVYSTPVSGVPDLVREDETGLLMDDKDPESVAKRIADTFDDRELKELSPNCRRTVQEGYSYNAAVKRYSRILEDISRDNLGL